MLFVPLILLLKLVVSTLTFPLTLLAFSLPTQFVDAIIFIGSYVMQFNGLFPVADLLQAASLLLTVYVIMLVVKVIFMGLNAIPGIHIKSPRESYISSSSVHTADNGTVFITTDKKHTTRNDRY